MRNLKVEEVISLWKGMKHDNFAALLSSVMPSGELHTGKTNTIRVWGSKTQIGGVELFGRNTLLLQSGAIMPTTIAALFVPFNRDTQVMVMEQTFKTPMMKRHMSDVVSASDHRIYGLEYLLQKDFKKVFDENTRYLRRVAENFVHAKNPDAKICHLQTMTRISDAYHATMSSMCDDPSNAYKLSFEGLEKFVEARDSFLAMCALKGVSTSGCNQWNML